MSGRENESFEAHEEMKGKVGTYGGRKQLTFSQVKRWVSREPLGIYS